MGHHQLLLLVMMSCLPGVGQGLWQGQPVNIGIVVNACSRIATGKQNCTNLSTGSKAVTQYMGSMVMIMKEILNVPEFSPFHNFTVTPLNSLSRTEMEIRNAMILSENQAVASVFGPESLCTDSGSIASLRNKLIVNTYCVPDQDDSGFSATTVTFRSHWSELYRATADFIKNLGSDRIVLINAMDLTKPLTNMEPIFTEYLYRNNISIFKSYQFDGSNALLAIPTPQSSGLLYAKILMETYLQARVYVYVCSDTLMYEDLSYFADTMERMGLIATGEYTVVAVFTSNRIINGSDVTKDILLNIQELRVLGAGGSRMRYSRTEKIFQMYRHLAILQETPNDDSTKFYQFKIKFIEASKNYICPPLCDIYYEFTLTPDYLDPVCADFYDAMYNYINITSKMLQENRSTVFDGAAIANQFYDMPYNSVNGLSYYINSMGRRVANVTVYNALTNKLGSNGIYAAGQFWLNLNDKVRYWSLHYYYNLSLNWLNGVPPLPMPKCGFEGELCYRFTDNTTMIVAVLSTVLALALTVSGYCMIRQLKRQKYLRSMFWRINASELVIQNFDVQLSSMKSLRSDMVDALALELHHANIATILGLVHDPPSVFLVYPYYQRGSLKDVLENDEIKLESMFISSLIFDIIKVNENGVCISLDSISSNFAKAKKINKPLKANLLWTAPEVLRETYKSFVPSTKVDVYAFGIMLHEIFGRRGAFGIDLLDATEIIQQVKFPKPQQPLMRPDMDVVLDAPAYVRHSMQQCWHEDPHLRPSMKEVREELQPLNEGLKSNIFDNMIQMLEKYSNNLEDLVAERTKEVELERNKSENLLLMMLPKNVAESLKCGRQVEPETFENVTIYFSDIVGFAELSVQSTPVQMVKFLHDLYSCFDSMIEQFDVYKVETIGDSYMVVSGLPIRNGDQHASEIASMALTLIHVSKSLTIHHRPGEIVKLRVGIHSGPCVAGVVGLKMPRYCLFGDTVNTTSRMESNGQALKIHCSGECKAKLDALGGYVIEERGYVKMKGKGERLTYWLVNEDKTIRQTRVKM